jgi:hypothetical protein
MMLCALVTGQLAGVSARPLFFPYVATSLAITLVSLLLTIFWWVVQLALLRADEPIRIVKQRLGERAFCFLLPALILPTFLASFTATKSAIPFLVGYTWDPFWTKADQLIFGDDAWRIAHHWLGSSGARPLEWVYVVMWGLGLLFVMALVALNAPAKFAGKVYTAMMATWLIGGAGMAYLLSAAGPVFAHLVSSDPAVQFADLRAALNSGLRPHGPIWTTQLYLPSALHSHVAVMGGGISAMPSMHLGTAAIYVVAARRTRWLIPAILFWGVIFVASGYFGYHYWIDGIVAAIVAAICWVIAGRLLKAEGTAAFDHRSLTPDVDDTGFGPQPIPSTR